MSASEAGPIPHLFEGVAAFSMGGGDYALEVVPSRGARVVSLRHDRHGEWLADSGRGWPRKTPVEYGDGDVRGWDECLPNVAPGRHPELDTVLSDHGEVWSRRWTATVADATLTTRVAGRLLPFDLRRDLTVNDGGVTAAYQFVNRGDAPYRLAWAMHALLDAAPSHLRLAADIPVRVDSVFGLDDSLAGLGWIPWGELEAQLPMNELDWAAKIFTMPGSTDHVLVDDGRGVLSIGIAQAPVPATFGLWLNAGGWSPGALPLRHLGVEPGFGDHDSLAEAVAAGSALRTRPDEPCSWTISITAT